MQLDQKALEAACEAYDAVASSNPRVAYAVSVGMKRAIRAYLQAVQPVPVVTDENVKKIANFIFHRLAPALNGTGPNVKIFDLAREILEEINK